MAELVRKGLAEEGHSVAVSHTGGDGLALAERETYDVIVLDVMLPGLDGCEIARRLRRARNRTPILMLTARDATSDVVEGLDAGADDYLTKPFSFVELLTRCGRGWARPVDRQVAGRPARRPSHDCERTRFRLPRDGPVASRSRTPLTS